MTHITDAVKRKSVVTKEEWREYTKTVWSIANISHKLHPAIFPLEIPHRLIKLFSFWGETVLDPFAGTGATAVAALQLSRNAICIDQNADYVKIARKRVKAEAAQSKTSLEAYVGDSRDLSKCKDNSIDLIVTSPPTGTKPITGSGLRTSGP